MIDLEREDREFDKRAFSFRALFFIQDIVVKFKNEWNLQQVKEDHPELQLNSTAPVGAGMEPEN